MASKVDKLSEVYETDAKIRRMTDLALQKLNSMEDEYGCVQMLAFMPSARRRQVCEAMLAISEFVELTNEASTDN
jgi:hypothetical protein